MDDKRVEAAAREIWDSVVWDAYTDRQQNARVRIVARALAASEAAAWQPIETAPREVSLLGYEKDGLTNDHGKLDFYVFYIDERSHSAVTVDGFPCWPTHWQPLPAPPSDATP